MLTCFIDRYGDAARHFFERLEKELESWQKHEFAFNPDYTIKGISLLIDIIIVILLFSCYKYYYDDNKYTCKSQA